MVNRILTTLTGGLLLALTLVGGESLAANESVQEGVEILGRGPVHEAFAQPLEAGVERATAVAPKAPPEPIEEQPPAQRPAGDDMQWTPGYWQWDAERGEFLWVTGTWRSPPPGRRWVPGSWRPIEGGYQWSDGFWLPEGQDDLRYLPPPPDSLEAGPSMPAPSDDCVYVPGLWVYRENRYVWRPGYWLRHRPGWVWSPSHYLCSPAGYLYVPGYWDYPLEQRGLLFASVCFGHSYPRLWTPSYTVGLDFLYGALFVRSGHRHYYYGDYFTADYRRRGFTPWVDHRVAGVTSDPLFGYYRSAHANRTWERDLRGLYTDRFAGRAHRPPQTLAQQNTAIRNATRDRPNVTEVSNLTVLRPLSQAARPETALVNVDRGERERQRQAAAQLRAVATQRVQAEKQIVVKKEAPSRSAPTPKTVTFDVPKKQSGPPPAERRATSPPPAPAPRQTREFRPSTELPREFPRPTPRIEEPKHVAPPAPRIDPPRQAPRIEVAPPRVEFPRTAPRVEGPKPAPTPAPRPAIEAPRPAPAPRPSVEARPAPRPAPAPARPAPAPRPSKPQAKPKR